MIEKKKGQTEKVSTIGIDARMYGKEQTGIGGYVEALVNGISELDLKNRYKLFLRPPYFGNSFSWGDNFTKIKAESRWYSWGEQTVFPVRLLSEGCDLVHFTHFSHPIIYPGDFIVTIHDLTPLYYPGKETSGFRKWAYKQVVRSACRTSKKIIAPSKYTKQDLVDNFNVGKDKIRVIYEGIKYDESPRDFDSYSDKRSEAFARLSNSYPELQKDFIFYTGVWRYHKNIEGLLEAFSLLKRECGCQLVLGGGRKEKDVRRIKKKISKLGLKGQVFLPGFLPEDDLKMFYRAASVFVLPSFYEGFGLVTLEALSQGTPVCCSSVGPLPEVLRDAALYFDPLRPQEMAERIKTILGKRGLASSLLKKADKRLRLFNWEDSAQETLDVYRSSLGFAP